MVHETEVALLATDIYQQIQEARANGDESPEFIELLTYLIKVGVEYQLPTNSFHLKTEFGNFSIYFEPSGFARVMNTTDKRSGDPDKRRVTTQFLIKVLDPSSLVIDQMKPTQPKGIPNESKLNLPRLSQILETANKKIRRAKAKRVSKDRREVK